MEEPVVSWDVFLAPTLIFGLGFFVRKWINSIDTKIQSFCSQNREEHRDLYNKTNNLDGRVVRIETIVDGQRRTNRGAGCDIVGSDDNM